MGLESGRSAPAGCEGARRREARRAGLFRTAAVRYNDPLHTRKHLIWRRFEMKRLAGLSVLAVLTVAVTVPAQEGALTHPYYPLKLGSEWVYKVQGGPIKVKVASAEKVGGTNGYKLETSA